MNIYRYTFASECPANGESIIYSLEIRSAERVMVEHIKTACGLHKRGYHEDIAADLRERFGDDLTLTANHHGVEIETAPVSAVPLVAEALREPVAYLCCGSLFHSLEAIPPAMLPPFGSPVPLYAAVPASLAPMPEECSVSQWSSRCCERGTKGCTVSHLRTAPRPTLPPDATPHEWREAVSKVYLAARRDGFCGSVPSHWLEIMRAVLASVAPQPEQPNTDSVHLADNGRTPVQGLDAADGVKGPDHG